jgi:hypothetical protein
MQKSNMDPSEQPVAEFEVGKGILFSANLNDLIEAEEPEVQEGPTTISIPKPGVNKFNQEPEEEEEEDSEEGKSDLPEKEDESSEDDITGDKYKDYSDSALYALSLESKRPGLFGDIKKEMSPEEFVELLDSKVIEAMDRAKEAAINSVSQGAEYIDILLNSPNPELTKDVIKQADLCEAFASMDLDDAKNEDIETMMKEMHRLKEIPTEDSEELIETFKESGRLKSKAKEGLQFFANLKQTLISHEKFQQDEYRRSYEDGVKAQRQEVDKVISSGKILGFSVPKPKQEEFKKWMYNPTEIVEYEDPQSKKKVSQRLTKAQVAMNEFNKSTEKQLAFYLSLMDNFENTIVKEEAKEERDNEILKYLGTRKGAQPKKTQRKNAFLDYN